MKIISFIALLIATKGLAADLFIRAGATGANTGLSWTDAWTNWNAVTWGTSNRYFLAGGNYGLCEIGADGVQIIRARATNSACSSVTGWSAGYDAVPSIHILRPYQTGQADELRGHNNFVIDGVVPLDGMIITNDLINAQAGAWDADHYGYTNVTIMNCDLGGAGLSNVLATAEIRVWNAGYNAFYGFPVRDGNTIKSCRLHNAATLITAYFERNFTVADCDIYENLTQDTVTIHPNGGQIVGVTNAVFARNRIHRLQDEGMMFGNTSGDAPSDNVKFIANAWFDMFTTATPRILTSQYTAQYRIHFWNNTVLTNSFGIRLSGENNGTWDTSCTSSNNYSFGSPSTDFGNANADYNLSDLASPTGAHSIGGASIANVLPNRAAFDFNIATNIAALYPRDKGVNMSAFYTTDAAGNTFGADGAWDIGAYEAVVSQSSPPASVGLHVGIQMR